MHLSNSLYIAGLQCEKLLWLKKYRRDLLTQPDKNTQTICKIDDEVKELAYKLFLDGIKVIFDDLDYEKMIKKTKELIDSNISNIYEASFIYDDVFVSIDILHINKDKSVEINEVKSSINIDDVYLQDVSIKYYVLNKLGFDIKKVNIIHLNKEYIRGDELDIDKLFKTTDVTDKIEKLQNEIPKNLERFKKVLSNKNELQIDIGEYCEKPYECEAIEYCWKHIPEYSIFDISGLRYNKKFQLYKQGIIKLEDIPDISTFSPTQQMQIQCELKKKSIINKEAIREFLESLSYPIYYLDFETFQQAIPKFKGVSSFMKIPFQYSLHIEKDGKLEHKEFLAEDGVDPRYEIAKHLVNDIPKDVTVLAYNKSFEVNIIKKLADEFDEFRDHLLCICENIKDLMIPFQKKYYYTPEMKGKHSIKYVLPALVPKMIDAYKELEIVQNGSDAMCVFANLSKIEDEKEKANLKQALLEYCKLDTLAMVEIVKKLREVVNE